MEKRYVIGLDIGTTSAKALLFTKNGVVQADHEEVYPTEYPQMGWVEQDPLDIEQGCINALKNVLEKSGVGGNEVASIGLSAAMHSIICADQHWNPLSPSITWADRRSTQQAEWLKATETGTDIYLKTGTPIHPMSPLAKLIWMKENDYAPYIQADRFISIKEFVTGRWFDTAAVDYSIAASSGMFNITTHEWEPAALQAAGISADKLSVPVEPTYIFQGLKEEVAAATGLPVDIPFAAGGSDGPLANLGIGAIGHGETAITIGTSGAIRTMSNQPVTDRKQQAFCYSVAKDLWVLGGPSNNGGNVLDWVKGAIGDGQNASSEADPYESLLKLAATAEAGSKGLMFLPYLNGERAPHWNAYAQGSYIGLSMEHKKEHMIRAAVEGVLFNMREISLSLESLIGKTTKLYASGGFARSHFWLQMLADMFNQDVHVPSTHQSSAWGAAWISLLAIGEVKSLHDIKHCVPMEKVIFPQENNSEIYQAMYDIFATLYRQLEPSYREIYRLKKDCL